MSFLPAPTSGHSSALFLTDRLFTDPSLGLDSRVWKCLSSLHLSRMSSVQAEAIPKLLQGQNAIVKAKTGSGKTLAYAIPLVQQVLLEQSSGNATPGTLSRIVLLPSHELCEQVRQTLQSLLRFCDDCVKVVALKPDSGSNSRPMDGAQIRDARPDILVATPSQLLAYCKHSAALGKKKPESAYLSTLQHTLKHLVLDEADLVLGMGYESELTELLNHSSYLGKGYQISLFSATLDEQIENLRNLYMSDAVTIAVEEAVLPGASSKLSQFYLHCSQRDKYLMSYALLKLGLIDSSRKVLFFFNSIPDAYRLKLFLEQFSISSAVLNHELPYNSRMSILDHFNRGLIDILIATDEASAEADEEEKVKQEPAKGKKRTASEAVKEEDDGKKKTKKVKKETDGDEDDEDMVVVKQENDEEEDEELEQDIKLLDDLAKRPPPAAAAAAAPAPKGKKGKKAALSSAVNVSRGVDFKDVGTVVNFDFPLTVKNYIHRIGRTARADRSGVALSFVKADERVLLEAVLDTQIERMVRAGVPADQAQSDAQPLPFDLNAVEGFRYRCDDIMRRVTHASIREARLKEIKMELLNSEKLRAHFEDNPRELNLLKHDQVLKASKVQKHLASVPTYLLPAELQPGLQASQANQAHAQAAAASDASRNKLRRQKHQHKIAAKNAESKLGLDKMKGYALKKAKGRHTMAMKNADPLRSFRAQSVTPTAAAPPPTGQQAAVDF